MVFLRRSLNRGKTDTTFPLLGGDVFSVPCADIAIEAVYHCDIYGARTVKVRTEVDISVFHRNLTAGMDGIFQKIAEKQA